MNGNQQIALDILSIMFPTAVTRWEEVKERLERSAIDTSSTDSIMTLSQMTRENLGWNVQNAINQFVGVRKVYVGVLSYYAYPEMYDAFNMPLVRGKWSYPSIMTRFNRIKTIYDNKMTRQLKKLIKRIGDIEVK
jgi:hypothetical protein